MNFSRGTLVLDFPVQQYHACEVPEFLKPVFANAPQGFFRSMDYLAVMESEEAVSSFEPNFDLISRLDLRGLIITAKGKSYDFVSRFFAPKYGVNEDPVTGSAHCVLAPYWSKQLRKMDLAGRQLSKRGGTILCRMEGERVFLSGKAIPYLEGFISI